jgi:transposase
MLLAKDAELDRLKICLKAVNALVMGARSERSSAALPEQLDLELGDLQTDVPPQTEAEETPKPPRPPRRKAKRNLGHLPKQLPRVEEILEPASKTCPCCHGELHKIGEDAAEALDYVPAILRVLRTIRPRYGCRACSDGVVQALAPPRVVEGGLPTDRLVCNVAVMRYVWHAPLHRQMQMLAGAGVELDRHILSQWMAKLAHELRSLYELQLQILHSFPKIFCDETRMPVLEAGRKTVRICQFWTHAVDDRSWGGPAPPMVIYIFARSRSQAEIRQQLARYAGLLQVDGYAAYKALAGPDRSGGPIKLAFCLAHARRKYLDVFKKTKSPFAAKVVKKIAEVYAVEARIKGMNCDQRLEVRKAQTAPLMTELKGMLETTLAKISAKSGLAGAIRYSLNHWDGLTLFLEDGRVEVDNNTVERTIRPIALGRRNSLFAGNESGAEVWAILSSLLTTAKLNGLDPMTWLYDVTRRIVTGEVKAKDLHQLLAWHWRPPNCALTEPIAA